MGLVVDTGSGELASHTIQVADGVRPLTEAEEGGAELNTKLVTYVLPSLIMLLGMGIGAQEYMARARHYWPSFWPANAGCSLIACSGVDFSSAMLGQGVAKVKRLFKTARAEQAKHPDPAG